VVFLRLQVCSLSSSSSCQALMVLTSTLQWEHGLMGLYSSHCSTLLSHSTTILRL